MTIYQRRILAAMEVLQAAGFKSDGATNALAVRIPTMDAPVGNNGKSGGRLKMLGGRLRFHLPGTDRYATVGGHTTFFYRKEAGKVEISDPLHLKTQDVEAIRAKAMEVAHA